MTFRKILALCLCLMLPLLPTLGESPAEETPAVETAAPAAPTVRVLLRRPALTDRADLLLTGDYLVITAAGTRLNLPAGTELTVLVRDNTLVLFLDDFSLDAGASLNLLRRGSAAPTAGLTIQPRADLYPGDLALTISGGMLRPVLTLSVEDYLVGVVPYEMSDSFPLEALKAQAVCARTYALSRLNPSQDYDLVDTTDDQVFRGYSQAYVNARRAISETAGLVLTSGDALAVCYYSASNGGQTELPLHVWADREAPDCYAITEDPYDVENPDSLTRHAILRKDGADLPEAFVALLREAVWASPRMENYAKTPEAFRVNALSALALKTPRFDAPSRLMTQLEVTFQVSARQQLVASSELSEFFPVGAFTVTLDLFPAGVDALGLSIAGANNEIITLEEQEESYRLTSGRFGHGVGMSQRGAQWMAGQYGKTFQEILAFYYPGGVLKQAASGPTQVPPMESLLADTPGPAASPTPRPTLMPVSGEDLPAGAWLASVEGIADDSTLNLRAEPSQSAPVIMRLYKHQLLAVLEVCDDPLWVRVRTDSVEGYVMVSFLEKVE